MSRFVVGAALAAACIVPTSATAAEVPPVNCDPVSCTELVERRVEAVQKCVDNGVAAIREALEGTPQPQTCP